MCDNISDKPTVQKKQNRSHGTAEPLHRAVVLFTKARLLSLKLIAGHPSHNV